MHYISILFGVHLNGVLQASMNSLLNEYKCWGNDVYVFQEKTDKGMISLEPSVAYIQDESIRY